MPKLVRIGTVSKTVKYIECKYSLAEYIIDISLPIHTPILTDFIELHPIPPDDEMSWLIIRAGYASDGPSGPTYDFKTSMPGAFVHDALYELIRKGYLPLSAREQADLIMHSIWIRDKFDKHIARRWYKGVKWFGRESAKPKNQKEILEAP